jgi:hypothetical protein
LGLCHCLQCFQKCPNWRPFPAIQTRLGLILEPHSPYFSDAGSWPFFFFLHFFFIHPVMKMYRCLLYIFLCALLIYKVGVVVWTKDTFTFI